MCHYETSWANEESYHEIIDEMHSQGWKEVELKDGFP